MLSDSIGHAKGTKQNKEAVNHSSANKVLLVYIVLRLFLHSCTTRPRCSVARNIMSPKSNGPSLMCAYSWTSSTAQSAASFTTCQLHTSSCRCMVATFFNYSKGSSCNDETSVSSTPNILKISQDPSVINADSARWAAPKWTAWGRKCGSPGIPTWIGLALGTLEVYIWFDSITILVNQHSMRSWCFKIYTWHRHHLFPLMPRTFIQPLLSFSSVLYIRGPDIKAHNGRDLRNQSPVPIELKIICISSVHGFRDECVFILFCMFSAAISKNVFLYLMIYRDPY